MSASQDTGAAATPLTRALDTIRRLRAQLDERSGRGPVAVIGVGLRLAGGIEDLDGYWTALAKGQDLVGQLPESRVGPFAEQWAQVPRVGGFLDEIMDFDADFFGLDPDEARGTDPQHRLLLEVAWEALEQAALAPDRLDAARTGLFVGITSQEYWNWSREYWDWRAGEPEPQWVTGNGHCFAVGRLAYALGIAGPAITVDTACSSSLVSVHLARQALARGDCDVALAGGVHLVLSPHGTRLLHRAGMLSPDGRCRAFDARANGLVRGEGCGIVVLKRLPDALRDGDRVHAVLHGSAVNQSGRATGFGAPNVLSEITLIERALADAGLSPADVGLVEAHGTGTSIGDTVEMEAIAAALGRRNGGAPLPVGSVKANLGHLEPAAGIASLIKAVLCLRHRAVPPLVHLSTVNPLIDLDGTGIVLPTELTAWPAGAGDCVAVNALGMGGTNAHVVVGPAGQATAAPAGDRAVAVRGFELSAKTPAAVRALADRYHRRLAELPDDQYPAFAYTATFGRARHPWRAAITAGDRTSALAALRALAAGDADAVPVDRRDEWDGEQAPPADLPRVVVDLPHYPWSRRRHAPEPTTSDSRLGAQTAALPAGAERDGPTGIRQQLLAAAPSRRTALLLRHCRGLAADVLGRSAADIDPTAPLASLGFDSMRTLELRSRLETSLQVKLSAAIGWQFPTLAALAAFLNQRIGPAAAATDDLSEEQIEALLAAKLDQLDAER